MQCLKIYSPSRKKCYCAARCVVKDNLRSVGSPKLTAQCRTLFPFFLAGAVFAERHGRREGFNFNYCNLKSVQNITMFPFLGKARQVF